MVQLAATPKRRPRLARFVAPVALAALVTTVVLVVMHPPGTLNGLSNTTRSGNAPVRKLPPYWIVQPGQTFAQIAQKTGLTIDQLEARNPQTDPYGLAPGQRLNLWRHPPAPRPKPLGPQFWTVRPGDSFGLIAAQTGINLTTLEQLNPRLNPATLQPGDRVRLRQ
jgi:LysM repeat protein